MSLGKTYIIKARLCNVIPLLKFCDLIVYIKHRARIVIYAMSLSSTYMLVPWIQWWSRTTRTMQLRYMNGMMASEIKRISEFQSLWQMMSSALLSRRVLISVKPLHLCPPNFLIEWTSFLPPRDSSRHVSSFLGCFYICDSPRLILLHHMSLDLLPWKLYGICHNW